jgi:hypothetical protein
MIIYRAVSAGERQDYENNHLFRTAKNTLEAKQFFLSETGALEFIRECGIARFNPPYKWLLQIEIEEDCLCKIDFYSQTLDGYKAFTIHEGDLPDFNN